MKQEINRFSFRKILVASVIFWFASTMTAAASGKVGTATVYVGSTTTISLASTYQYTLKNATNVTYYWKSGNTSYVTISSSTKYQATIKGVASTGTSTCKVYFYASYFIDGYYRTMDFYYDVTVVAVASTVYVTSVVLSQSSATLTEGETLSLTASVYPTNATNRSVTWSTSNSSVATVSSGLVTAKSAGTATIKATSTDGTGKYGTCTVTVISSNDSEDESEDEDVSGDNGNGDDSSDGSSSNALLLFTKDGGEMSYLLSERPRVTHFDDYLVITSDVAEVSYPLTDIWKFTFGQVDVSSGIDNVPVDEASFNIDDGVLMLSGFREGSTVRIFTMGGMMVHSEKLDGGSCTYCMSALSPGIYLVNVNDKTFKIAKK